jgi:hypothetical protein
VSAPPAPPCSRTGRRTAERRQAERRLALDKCFQSQMNQPGFLFDTGKNLGFGHQFIVQIDGRPDAYKYARSVCISQPARRNADTCRRLALLN